MLFALILLDGSVLGALVVTLGASYAVGDVFGVRHSLHRRWRDAPTFYGVFVLMVALASAVVLVPDAPLGIVTTAVQALAGVLLPSALVFLVLLCNDREVLGPWTNPPWLNAIAVLSIGVLLVLSALLTSTTLVPSIGVTPLLVVLVGALVIVLVVLAWTTHWRRDRRVEHPSYAARERWSMAPLESLAPCEHSLGRRLGLILLRVYLTVASVLLVVSTVRSLTGR